MRQFNIIQRRFLRFNSFFLLQLLPLLLLATARASDLCDCNIFMNLVQAIVMAVIMVGVFVVFAHFSGRTTQLDDNIC